jgi:predicted regulator of Ras-like GTPase activity (Roadblock/LC7/MglB family)
MNLPPRRKGPPISRVLPLRKRALQDRSIAWDLLDDLHRLPGVRGSAISTRAGQISLSDVSDETERSDVVLLARTLAHDFREMVSRLNMGPMRMMTLQATTSTIVSAPTGLGMLLTLADGNLPTILLRQKVTGVQDELGRVELVGLRLRRT